MIKNNKEQVYALIQEEAAKGNNQITTMVVADRLKLQRTNVSSILNQLVEEGKITKTTTRPVYYSLSAMNQEEEFSSLIGRNNTLISAVQLAKAAVLYPGKSLNTLIYGKAGTGKSYLADLMFDFAKRRGVVDKEKRLIKVNCRHYQSNPSALMHLLFGREGEGDFPNVFDEAENSFLLLDNIQFLDSRQFALLNTYLESGEYHYEGETEAVRKNVTVILTLDEEQSKDMLGSLTTRLSIRIHLPSLKEWTWTEKGELIAFLLNNEARNTGHTIVIDPDILHGLILVDSPMNVKHLAGMIKAAIANAYLRTYDSDTTIIQLRLNDFEKSIANAAMHYRSHREEIDRAIPVDYRYSYDGTDADEFVGNSTNDFYEYINRRARELRKRGLDKASIDAILNVDFEKMIDKMQDYLQSVDVNSEQLQKVVAPEIIPLVQAFINRCNTELDRDLSSSVVYGLCLHLNAIYKNKRNEKVLSNDKINEVIASHPREYQLMAGFASELSSSIGLLVSMDEIVIMTMFLVEPDHKQSDGAPVILFAMHGESSADSLAQVVNTLVKADNTHAYDMSLNKPSDVAYEELKEKVLSIDEGAGILVIYDMGSLKTMLERINEETGVELRLIYMPITLVGLDASRKASMDHDLDNVYHEVISNLRQEAYVKLDKPTALITLCHTGEGGAREIKDVLQDKYKASMKIYPLSISDRKELSKEVRRIRSFYEVEAFVGTYDPHLYGIPFIPVSRVFEMKEPDLNALLYGDRVNEGVDESGMLNYLAEGTRLSREDLEKTLPALIEELDEAFGLDVDLRVGLFLHIGVVIQRLLQHEKVIANARTQSYLLEHKADMKIIKNALKKTERVFSIIVPDDEVANILSIVRKEEQQ